MPVVGWLQAQTFNWFACFLPIKKIDHLKHFAITAVALTMALDISAQQHAVTHVRLSHRPHIQSVNQQHEKQV
jgi:hypothetical protein